MFLKSFLFSLLLLICTPINGFCWDKSYLYEFFNHELSELNSPYQLIAKRKILDERIESSWCSAEKTDCMIDLIFMFKPSVVVDIGAGTGASTYALGSALKSIGKGKVFAIDAWSNSVATRNMDPMDPNKMWWSQVDMNALEGAYDHLVQHFNLGEYCVKLKKTSSEALSDLPETIDLLHIDGDYSRKGSLEDVLNYMARVKSGGFIILSNFFITINGDQPKVDAYCKLYEECEFITGVDNFSTIVFIKN